MAKTEKELLIGQVLTRIEEDIAVGDFTAIEELLSFCPPENLLQYLPEKDWKNYDINKM